MSRRQDPILDIEISDRLSSEDEEGISDNKDDDTVFHNPPRDSEFLVDLETVHLTNNIRIYTEHSS